MKEITELFQSIKMAIIAITVHATERIARKPKRSNLEVPVLLTPYAIDVVLTSMELARAFVAEAMGWAETSAETFTLLIADHMTSLYMLEKSCLWHMEDICDAMEEALAIVEIREENPLPAAATVKPMEHITAVYRIISALTHYARVTAKDAGKIDCHLDPELSDCQARIQDMFSRACNRPSLYKLIDDGTMDTVIQCVDGRERRYSQEIVGDFRNPKTGELDMERFVETVVSVDVALDASF